MVETEHMVDTVMRLVGSEIGGMAHDLPNLTMEDYQKLYAIACDHGLAALFCSAVKRRALIDPAALGDSRALTRDMISAAVLVERQQYELERICGVLAEEKIPHMPLKGAVIRAYYPQSWMRTGRDIDLLVKPEDHDRAFEAICSKLGYAEVKRTAHDVCILSEKGIWVELHFALMEESKAEKWARPLANVWTEAVPDPEHPFRYAMHPPHFFYYHLVHMAKHVRIGGCGLRPFADLWLLMQRPEAESEELAAWIEESGLTTFAETARQLCRIWFAYGAHHETTVLFCDFLQDGGLSGDSTFSMLNKVRKGKGKFGYILAHIFVKPDVLKAQYAILEKWPIAYPVCAIHRLFSLAFGRRRQIRRRIMGQIGEVENDQLDLVRRLWSLLELE